MENGIDTIVLVRHGRTGWNRERRFRGRTDLPLDEVGFRQAEATGAFVAELAAPRAIVSSPLRRAVDTAAPIGQRAGLAAAQEPGFIAMSFGAWEGRAAAEIAALWPEQYRLWLERPVDARPPGGETLDDVRARASAALDRVLASPGGGAGGGAGGGVVGGDGGGVGDAGVGAIGSAAAASGSAAPANGGARALVVVAHTVVHRMLALHLLGLDSANFWSLALRPCGVSVMRRLRARWTIELWNATQHLAGPLEDGPDA